MKLNNFKILPPNFAICDKGKFALRELDDEDFEEYMEEYKIALINNREKQKESHNVSSANDSQQTKHPSLGNKDGESELQSSPVWERDKTADICKGKNSEVEE